ncbi:hypothetical protein Pmani_010733 [Petrolisthes manimaculis]|uniref:Uncharacterized protein n=1 Tax=Petrolisthes manimaculis TaxID=1843537 RepID=A0AAE1Q158_9EUCA|nr:hypothetical protein Pmani_010733 [Petrolisthes manimaculis]
MKDDDIISTKLHLSRWDFNIWQRYLLKGAQESSAIITFEMGENVNVVIVSGSPWRMWGWCRCMERLAVRNRRKSSGTRRLYHALAKVRQHLRRGWELERKRKHSMLQRQASSTPQLPPLSSFSLVPSVKSKFDPRSSCNHKLQHIIDQSLTGNFRSRDFEEMW